MHPYAFSLSMLHLLFQSGKIKKFKKFKKNLKIYLTIAFNKRNILARTPQNEVKKLIKIKRMMQGKRMGFQAP